MSDRYLELAPLAALDALDGEDRVSFEAHVSSCPACAGELQAQRVVSALIPLALAPVPPSPDLRHRVLAAAGAPAPTSRASWWAPLAAAAALLLGIGLLVSRSQRDESRREAEQAREAVAAAESRLQQAERELAAAQQGLARERALRETMARPDARVAQLAGLPAAPGARARVVWSPGSREAVLLASGLDMPPRGRAYEVWVIAQGPPVPAGVFRPDADGQVIVRLPRLEATARVKTFAVTIEPESGTPAPTGPMVLAGAVS
jgi:hypothetical protein